MALVDSVTQLIGDTPLIRLHAWEKAEGVTAKIFGKMESRNPAGSAKDRIALAMIEEAEASGVLKPGAVIIEPTSGNTGIGLASVAAARGYRAIFTMPDTMSVERRLLLAAYGAEIVLTPGKDGMKGSIDKAMELAREIPGAWIPGQFTNPANPTMHYRTTGPEIWRDLEGRVDVLVAGVGTGGTLSGAGRFLKEKNPTLKVIAVEPDQSPVLTEGRAGPHGLMGIGANFVPDTLSRELIDEIVRVKEEEAYEAGRRLPTLEGFLIGISGGAALHAATQLAKRPDMQGKTIVVIFPDSGERYLSTPLYQ